MNPKSITGVLVCLLLLSCWKFQNQNSNPRPKVWGYKPIYGADTFAKKISYSPYPQRVMTQGNIYAFRNYIFQLDAGLGIHVIDNSTPSFAHRIGFITVRGCSQISIKNDKLYTNSYDDLVVLDVSNLNSVHEVSRLAGVFTEYKYDSPIAQPPTGGYYECPAYDKLVVGWTQDSIYQSCFK
jgi:hypothetical protein